MRKSGFGGASHRQSLIFANLLICWPGKWNIKQNKMDSEKAVLITANLLDAPGKLDYYLTY